MNLEVGKTYIRKDFLYSAVIVGIIDDVVTYKFRYLKDGHKGRAESCSTVFSERYTIASELLMALI